jgi:hypothetical protein
MELMAMISCEIPCGAGLLTLTCVCDFATPAFNKTDLFQKLHYCRNAAMVEHKNSNDHHTTYKIEMEPTELRPEKVVEEQVELELVHVDRFTETPGGAKLCDLLVSVNEP